MHWETFKDIKQILSGHFIFCNQRTSCVTRVASFIALLEVQKLVIGVPSYKIIDRKHLWPSREQLWRTILKFYVRVQKCIFYKKSKILHTGVIINCTYFYNYKFIALEMHCSSYSIFLLLPTSPQFIVLNCYFILEKTKQA